MMFILYPILGALAGTLITWSLSHFEPERWATLLRLVVYFTLGVAIGFVVALVNYRFY